MIDPGTLAEMRAISDANLPYLATIQSQVDTVTEGGQHTLTWGTVSVVNCRLSVPSAEERIVADQPTGRTQWLVVFKAGTVITDDQRVVVEGEDAAGIAFTKTLGVLGVNAPLVFELYRQVVAEEVG